jgi:hypothetical protein
VSSFERRAVIALLLAAALLVGALSVAVVRLSLLLGWFVGWSEFLPACVPGARA